MAMMRWMRVSTMAAMSMATIGFAQQPVVEHAQVTARSGEHGLAAELETATRTGSPVWVGWSIPVQGGSSSDWGSDQPVMLEGGGGMITAAIGTTRVSITRRSCCASRAAQWRNCGWSSRTGSSMPVDCPSCG